MCNCAQSDVKQALFKPFLWVVQGFSATFASMASYFIFDANEQWFGENRSNFSRQVLPQHPGPSNAAEGPALCLWTVVWIYSRPYISTHSFVFKLWGDRRVTNCRNPHPINFPMQILDLFIGICSHTSRRLSRNPRRPCATDISQSPGIFHIYFSPVATETLCSRGDGRLTRSLGMQMLSLGLRGSKNAKTVSGVRCHWSSQKWELS